MKVVIFIPSEANQWLVVLVLKKMLANHVEVVINFNIFFIEFVQIFLHVFFLIYENLYILMQRPKMFQLMVKIDAGHTATFKKKVVYPPQLIRPTFLIYHGKQTWRNAPYKGVNKLMQNCREISWL